MIEITQDPIFPEAIINKVRKDAYGAVVAFVGMVRGYSSDDKRVLSLEFEADEETTQKLQQIVDEIKARWQLHDVAMCHRFGRLKVGETTLVIAVGAPHRQECHAIMRPQHRVRQESDEPPWPQMAFARKCSSVLAVGLPPGFPLEGQIVLVQ